MKCLSNEQWSPLHFAQLWLKSQHPDPWHFASSPLPCQIPQLYHAPRSPKLSTRRLQIKCQPRLRQIFPIRQKVLSELTRHEITQQPPPPHISNWIPVWKPF